MLKPTAVQQCEGAGVPAGASPPGPSTENQCWGWPRRRKVLPRQKFFKNTSKAFTLYKVRRIWIPNLGPGFGFYFFRSFYSKDPSTPSNVGLYHTEERLAKVVKDSLPWSFAVIVEVGHALLLDVGLLIIFWMWLLPDMALKRTKAGPGLAWWHLTPLHEQGVLQASPWWLDYGLEELLLLTRNS